MLQMMLFALFMICAVTMQAQDKARAVRTGELTLNGPLEKVFALFTPEGETLWIPSWKWTPVYPAGKETVRDMVFRTDQQTLWTLAVYEPPRRSVYVHTSPDLLAKIEVVCEAIDAKHTRMKITWVLTALTEHGQMVIDHHETEAHQAEKMANWKKWLDDYAMKEGWSK